MSDKQNDGGTHTIHKALLDLRETGEQQQVTLQTDPSGRTQTVTLLAEAGSAQLPSMAIAYSLIAEKDQVDETALQDWAAAYPALQFRFVDGYAVAYAAIPTAFLKTSPQRIIERLARIADRLEYELGEGDDRH